MIPQHIFREYDIRGIAEDELTDSLASGIGKSFGTYLRREGKKRIAVGHDLRPSSERIFNALTQGLQSAGLEVLGLGLIPTPLLYFSVSHYRLDAGISITGSHNPPEFNGFKLHLADRPFFGADIQKLRGMIEAGDFESGKGSFENRGNQKIIRDYIDYVAGIITCRKKLKVVVDAGHGMGGIVAPDLVKRLGHEVIELYTNLDSTFPDHHPDPSVPANLKDLQQKVKASKADLGIAFDGDADRIGVVDETGEIIAGDHILLIYARALLKTKPGSVIIGDVKCSQFFYDDIKKRGGKPVMWKTGHSLIKSKMKETGAELAGEMSGHMFFKDRWFGFDDALYAACRMLEILDQSGAPLSSLLADLPKLVSTPEIRVDCPDDLKFDLVRRAVESFKEKYPVIDIDGARIQFEDGWGLVRASNTQPILVMRFEARSQESLSKIREIVENQIQVLRQGA